MIRAIKPHLILIAALVIASLLYAAFYKGGGVNMLTGQADAAPATPAAPEQSGDTQNTEPEKTPESASGQAEPTQTPKPSNSGRLVPYAEANGLWGYKNTSGQVVIEAVFSEAYEFDGDVAFAAQNGMFGLINRSGAWLAEPAWEHVSIFSEDKAAVESGDRWGYIDRTGKLIIDYSFREVGDFHCGRAMARSGLRIWVHRC